MKYEKTRKISFPLGGIGSGCIGLAGNGELIDWEIFNRPNKNTRNGYSHFAIKAVCKDKTVAKILQGDTVEDLTGTRHPDQPGGFDFGPRVNSMAGFPHFKNVEFDGEFPLAKLTYSDELFPGKVSLCAFNPMIPHDAFNSSLPASFFQWEIKNTTKEDIKYSISLCVQNPWGVSKNEKQENGCFLYNDGKDKEEIGYGDLTILTDNEGVNVQPYWYRGNWQDGVTTYWKEFSACTPMPERTYETAGTVDHSSVVASVKIKAGEKKSIRFVLAWNVPVQYNYWLPYRDENDKDITWKNYYATQFDNSLDTAKYALSKFSELLLKTESFAEALHSSTLPDFVIDAVTANLSVLKSSVVLRLEDGSFWGWEGVHDRAGLCEGSCQHVWNYAYALPFLFPELERSMRENTIKYGTNEHGKSTFRIPLPLGRRYDRYIICVDGQMGEVIKCYREWKISGDNEWLKKNSETIFKMLEYAWNKENEHGWDTDCDGVMEGRQHNTLDIELFGPNSWLEGFYLAALDCGAQMAEALGENERAEKYRSLYASGKKWTNENLFNGEYFGHIVDLTDKSLVEKYSAPLDYYWNDEAGQIKYQLGEGCIIDQMLADWHCAILGIDSVFDKDKKHVALQNLYKNNFKPSMRTVANAFRNFALNDEAGVLICTYPEGKNEPKIPILYSTETMTGFEYALAGLLLSEGYITEAESIVKAVRDRYDGEKRNPWSELECGHNYARSMASYALLNIYSGFSFDMTKNYMGFKPINKHGSYFWSVKDTYGNVKIESEKTTLSVIGNELKLSSFGLSDNKKVISVFVDGTYVPFEQKDNVLSFSEIDIKCTLEIICGVA